MTDAAGGDTTGAVVVVNFGSSDLLRRNLPALSACAPAVRVVVVDNFSTAEERRAVEALADRHRWDLVLEDNRGFGAGMNAGAARAAELGCGGLLLLNPDVTVEPAVVLSLLDQARREPDAMVTPLIRAGGVRGFAEGSLDLARGTTRIRPPLEPAHERWLSGACLALSMQLWRRLGGFAEDYFMYWEDIDLSHRCLRLGGRLVVRKDLEAEHEVGGTQGPAKSPLYRYYNCRNRLLFARHHVPRRQAWGWLRATPRYAVRVLLRDGRGAVLRRPATTVVPVLRGTVAGVRLLLLGR